MEEGTRASTDCAGGAPPLPVPSTGDAPVSASSLAAAAGSGSGDEAAEIQLVAAEGDVIGVPRHLAMQSGFLKSMIDDRDEDGSDGGSDGGLVPLDEIPLPSIGAKALRRVVKFWAHYHDDPLPPIEKPLRSGNIFEVVPEWYAEFIVSAGSSHDDLYDVIMAANFLDVRALLDLGCAFIASQIRDKSMEQVCETFGVANRMTRADELALRQDPRNAWVFQDLDA